MKNINTRRLYYHIRHRYLTMNNVVIGIALVIGVSWAWGSIGMMQRNYDLQKSLDAKVREQKLAELEVATLNYQKRYFQSDEYKELSVREHLGLANPGEKVLVLPPNSAKAKHTDTMFKRQSHPTSEPPGNFQQWMNFLFGGSRKGLQD